MLRAEPALFGPVASDPVVSRLITRLAADTPAALAAIGPARAAARERAWQLAGDQAPGADGRLIPVDIDATIVTAHSERRQAVPTWKKIFGFHPLTVFADHGPGGSGESLAIMLRPGCATCRCTGMRRTRSGARSSPWPCELIAWTQLLALHRSARRREPKRLRLRLFSAAGRIVRGSRRRCLPPGEAAMVLATHDPEVSERCDQILDLSSAPV